MAKAKTATASDADANLPTSKQADEARELGIEPSGYTDSKQLQERIEQVRAEKEAVGGDTSISEARAANDGSNDNLNTATDDEAENTRSNQ